MKMPAPTVSTTSIERAPEPCAAVRRLRHRRLPSSPLPRPGLINHPVLQHLRGDVRSKPLQIPSLALTRSLCSTVSLRCAPAPDRRWLDKSAGRVGEASLPTPGHGRARRFDSPARGRSRPTRCAQPMAGRRPVRVSCESMQLVGRRTGRVEHRVRNRCCSCGGADFSRCAPEPVTSWQCGSRSSSPMWSEIDVAPAATGRPRHSGLPPTCPRMLAGVLDDVDQRLADDQRATHQRSLRSSSRVARAPSGATGSNAHL